VIPTMK